MSMSDEVKGTLSFARWKTAVHKKAVAEHERVIVDAFIMQHLLSIQQILSEERKILRSQPSESLKGQIKYHTHQVATMKWLLSVNAQRKESPNVSAECGTTRRKSKRTGGNDTVGSAENRQIRQCDDNAG